MTPEAVSETADILWGLLTLIGIVAVVIVELHWQNRQDAIEERTEDLERRVRDLEGR